MVWKKLLNPAFLQPISKKISSVCTPRVCISFDTPIFNIGSSKLPKWVRINKDGEISQTENPQEFIPQSHNKEQQIFTRQSNIHSNQQRKEYRKLSLIKDRGDLITEEIVFNMFPMKEMNNLDEEIELKRFSVNDYISSHLQEVFLPWPLSALHLLPDWVILSGLIIIGVILIKIFIDLCMAICHLLRDSSLTITEKIISAIISAPTVIRLNRKGNLDIEDWNLAAIELPGP